MTDETLVQQNAEQQIAQEKMLSQSEVNDLAGKIRAEATEKARREMLAAQAAQLTTNGALSEEQVRNMILEQTQSIQQEQAQRAMAERVVGEFAGKMELGKEAYDDFNDVVQQIDLSTVPEIVQLANSVSNTHDVIYDLANNPYKIANLLTLARTSPALARAEMNRLSQSIIANKSAISQSSGTKEPLSQMRSSSNTTVSGANPTLKELKSMKWLRR